jgi:hypothetical protein
MTDDLKQRAEAVLKDLKQISSANGNAPDVVHSVSTEARAVIQALLEADNA